MACILTDMQVSTQFIWPDYMNFFVVENICHGGLVKFCYSDLSLILAYLKINTGDTNPLEKFLKPWAAIKTSNAKGNYNYRSAYWLEILLIFWGTG